MTKNKLQRIFLVAFKERTDGAITAIYPDNQPKYFHSLSEAESFLNELIKNKTYLEDEIEIIKVWKIQNFKN